MRGRAPTTEPYVHAWAKLSQSLSASEISSWHDACELNGEVVGNHVQGVSDCVTVAGLVAANRLVTLTGAGGCGKTRISIQVASGVGEKYADGVWWVDLARLSDDALLANAVAAVLAIKEVPGRSFLDTVKNHLRDQRVLLVLDNCEHVVDACAHLVHVSNVSKGCGAIGVGEPCHGVEEWGQLYRSAELSGHAMQRHVVLHRTDRGQHGHRMPIDGVREDLDHTLLVESREPTAELLVPRGIERSCRREVLRRKDRAEPTRRSSIG
jgi:hypothetical protein